MRIWVAAHAVDDFYQGLVPAAVPFFVLERGYSYTAAAALAMAATLGSALPQPVLGLAADRWRMSWLAPLGVAVAGIGAGLSGWASPYWLVWSLLLLSGLGVAAFHPAAGRDARRDAGDSATAMSLFAAGGSVGFFLAPALLTPVLLSHGVSATVWFLAPAVLTGFVLYRDQVRRGGVVGEAPARAGKDAWGPFLVLTAVSMFRSVVFSGMNTFIGLYWIAHLGGSQALAGVALTAFLAGGFGGALLGGRMADRVGAVRAVQIGCIAAIPAMMVLRFVPSPVWALPLAVIAGAVINMPFGVIVKLGQDYLPSRPGTAAGVTLGLSVSAGGLLLPVLGTIGDSLGPQTVLAVLCVIPVAAVALALRLPQAIK
jgi:FSR family fosmidomycin resistance protein-like MFS transporter